MDCTHGFVDMVDSAAYIYVVMSNSWWEWHMGRFKGGDETQSMFCCSGKSF